MAHSRIDGVCDYRPGKVAGVADVPLHGVFLLRQVRLATVLTKMQADGEYISRYSIRNKIEWFTGTSARESSTAGNINHHAPGKSQISTFYRNIARRIRIVDAGAKAGVEEGLRILPNLQRSHCGFISLSVHVVSISSGSTDHARYTCRFTMDVTTRHRVGPPSIVSCLSSYREGAHSGCLQVVFIRGSEHCPTS